MRLVLTFGSTNGDCREDRIVKLLFVAAALIASGIAAAVAQELPRFDVDRHCRTVAAFGGTYSESLFGGCMDMEQTAYDELKGRWSQLPSTTRQHCIQVARFADPGSYSLLQGCLQMETQAGQSNRSRQFRY
jgi:hypothetical protein